MKPSHRCHPRSFLNLTVCLSMAVLPIRVAAATDRYWNPGGTGGDGNWGTSPGDKNWNLVPGAAVGNTPWPNTIDDAANFQTTTGGTVTVFGDVQTTRITQNGADYTINAGTVALVRDSSAVAPAVAVATGTLTIDSVLVGSDGLRKMGAANLVLSGANAYTGATSVESGTFTLTGSLISGVVRIDPTGTLMDVSGGLAPTTALRNLGIFTVSADESVATYIQEIGATFSGTGPLTATGGSTLNGGTVEGILLGNTDITGAVLVSGTLGGGSLSVANTGTLTLTGTYTGSSVTIALNGGLVDANGGLADSAAVTNTGTLTVNAEDYISTYLQNVGGTLTGTGILNVTDGATLAGGTVSGNLAADIVATGSVTISGNVTGNSLSVQGGMVVLSGQSTHVLIGISENSSLSDLSGGLADHAEVTNSGLLDVYSDDTVRVYVQNGGGSRLGGDSTLTVTDGIVLNGGSVSGKLSGNAISTGAVVVSGEIGGGILAVNGGTFSLSGVSTHSLVEIATNARFNDLAAGLDAGAAIINHGILAVENSNDTVRTYLQDGSGMLSGVATLTATNGATLHGGTVSGGLLGDTVSTGNVLISGMIGGGNLAVTGGTLTLSGISKNQDIQIAPFASLLATNSGLDSFATVTNAGRLALDVPDEILTYVSNGGVLEGAGKLSTSSAALNDQSFVTGSLEADSLTTQGAVSVTGSAVAANLRIGAGVLTNTGLLGSDSTHMDIASGATLVASGNQLYSLLTSSGSGTAKWQGNLKNFTTVAPGVRNGFGNLVVTGDFTNAPSGTLEMDVAASGHDRLGVGGTAAFGGTLSVNQLGPEQIPSFIPVQLVSAASYTGNFASFNENLDGVVFFNPLNGSITRVGLGSGSDNLFAGTTRNQRSTWIALYDDVIDPGKINVTRDPAAPSGYQVTSGLADEGNPDLLRGLAASFTPAGLDTNLLNHLSAEVYTSVLDYAVQATRQHQRTALSAPALAPRADVPGLSSKASAKDAIPPTPSFGRDWEFFAAADYFHAETDTSRNHADYNLSGAGFVFGARNQLTDRFQLAGYAAADLGSMDGSLIHSDQDGWSLGLIGQTLLDAKSHTVLTTALSYGSYKSDGTRESAAATGAGWMPGKVKFNNIDSNSLELYAGVETTVYRDQRFRVIPSAGLRYTSATMDGFTESTGSAVGSPIALKVNRDSYDQWTLEMGVAAEASLTDQFTLQGQLGINAGLDNHQHDIRSRFVKGNRTMSAEADGLTDDLFYLGLGLEYRFNQDVTVGVGYRSDFRPSHPIEQGCNVSSTFRF